jgi:nitrite reductase/ring-hydroxylating ferredoxin subunit
MATVPQGDDVAWQGDWFAVAPLADLAADGDHVTIALPPLSLTFQNFRGALRGFWNVCSHRAALMRPCGRGNGLLRCPYHGWTYNADGVPVGIPDNDTLFGLNRDDKRRLALRPVETAVAGPWIFARVGGGDATLRAALGAAAGILDEMRDSTAVADREAMITQPWQRVRSEWCSTPPAGERLVPSPNLAIDRAGGWMLTRTVLPHAAERSTVRTVLWRGGDATSPPRDLQRLFDGTDEMGAAVPAFINQSARNS